MVAQFVADLRSSLAPLRLEAYRPGTNGFDLDMVVNYFWNIDLAGALVSCLHAAELALRNSLNDTLVNHFQTDMWFYEPNFLQSGQLMEFAKALGKVVKKPPPLAGRLVAELTFGFWTAIISSPYDYFWKSNGYHLFYQVFPNATGISRQDICAQFVEIKNLRNRIAHYEAIWHMQDLQQKHQDIYQAIQWISPTLGQAIAAVDDFQAILTGKAQVETSLKAHVGIP